MISSALRSGRNYLANAHFLRLVGGVPVAWTVEAAGPAPAFEVAG